MSQFSNPPLCWDTFDITPHCSRWCSSCWRLCAWLNDSSPSKSHVTAPALEWNLQWLPSITAVNIQVPKCTWGSLSVGTILYFVLLVSEGSKMILILTKKRSIDDAREYEDELWFLCFKKKLCETLSLHYRDFIVTVNAVVIVAE